MERDPAYLKRESHLLLLKPAYLQKTSHEDISPHENCQRRE